MKRVVISAQSKRDILANDCQGRDTLATASFSFHGQEDITKAMDAEGQVLEPLECGDHCSGTGVMALTGVHPLNASLYHSY
jgi:hypothetical protein